MDRVQGNGGSQRGIGSKNVGSLYGEYKGLFNYENYLGGDKIKAAYVARILQQLEGTTGTKREEIANDLVEYITDNILRPSTIIGALLEEVKGASLEQQEKLIDGYSKSPCSLLYICDLHKQNNPVESFIGKLERKNQNITTLATAARDLNHDLDAIIGHNQSETSDKLKSTMVAQALINYSDQVGGDELLSNADVYAALRTDILNSSFFNQLLKIVMDKTDPELEKIFEKMLEDLKDVDASFEQIAEFLSELGRHVDYLRKQQENKRLRESGKENG